MIVSHVTHDTVLHVAMNMRDADKREIYALRWEDNPFLVTNDVMAARNFSWVAWLDGRPCAVFGGAPLHPGVWSMFMFATDDFRRLALGLTRMARRQIVPRLFGEIGAHRLQCHSHVEHEDAHRWLASLGCERESILKGFGRDGSDYIMFTLSKVENPVDRKTQRP